MTAGCVVPCSVDTGESIVSTPTLPMLEHAIGGLLGRPVADVTPARVFLGHVSGSYRTESLLALFGDQALARRAVTEPLDLTTPPLADVVHKLGIYEVASAAPTMAVHLADPLRGRRLSAEARRQIQAGSAKPPRVQFVIGDGLSTTAVHVQVPRLLPTLLERCAEAGWSVGTPFAVRHCRVGVLGDIGEVTGADVVALLIGERPGLLSFDSLSVYAEWRPNTGTSDADRNVISNIHDRGLPAEDAIDRTMALLAEILDAGVSGVPLRSAGSPAVAATSQATAIAGTDTTALTTNGGTPC
jgi:ethanolamine ammonia-lyase small subunit